MIPGRQASSKPVLEAFDGHSDDFRGACSHG
jgi:hypothetical protein